MTNMEYHQKSIRMEELLKQLTVAGELDTTLQKELDQVSDEIARYEESKYPFQIESLKEMIEVRMFQQKLKQKDLAELLGTSPSRISEILKGKRPLNFELAKALYNKLQIDAKFIFQD